MTEYQNRDMNHQGQQLKQPQGLHTPDRHPDNGIERRNGVDRRDAANASGFQNEGEGSRSAARHYDEGVRNFVRSGQVEQKAQEAAQALDSGEAEELERAEREGLAHRNIKDRSGKH